LSEGMLEQPAREANKSQRLSGKLARKFAFVLLPLVLVPLIVMGVVAYLRMRSTLRQEAVDQMIYAIQGQSTALVEWASIREQRLFIGSQRPRLQEDSSVLLFHPEDQEAISSIQEELETLLNYQGDRMFAEIFLVRKSDGLVISSTDTKHNGLILQYPPLKTATGPETIPLYDDPNFTPDTLGLLCISPLRVVGAQPDFYLGGLNSGSEVVQLIEELQVFWQRRGVYRVERGKTFLALSPDFIFELPRYATNLEVLKLPDHDIFQVSTSAETGTLEYENDEGQPVLSAYHWIPDWNLALVVELVTSDIFSSLSDLAPFMAILIAIAAIFTLSIAFMATNRMLQPLTSLAEFANRISLGEWLYRVSDDRDDELGALASSLNRMAEELGTLYQSLESRVEDRTRQIRTASEVARAIISIPNLDELLRQAAQLIKDRFGYDHVSIFLLDSTGQYAELRESAGEIGGITRPSGYEVEVNSQTLVGWVIENNSPRVVTDTSDEPELFKSGLLRGARTQVSVPLQVAGRSLGIIDVQNIKLENIQQEDLEVLQTLADQLSSAIENARLAQESADAAERARLISEITTQLSGILEPQQVLQTAAYALHRALGNAEIVVKLVPPDESPP
jgi:HAMP domain-containing protein/putative methionine-R-sulfoxide reductase with GAF domain